MRAERPALFTSSACHCTLLARRSAKCSIPAPTVSLLMRSMRMNPPVSRFTAYASNGIERSSSRLHTPISLSSSVAAARCCMVFMLILYLSGEIVAVAVRVPIFKK